MLFNSIEFAIFLPAVFIIYWLIPDYKFKLQNIWLLFASYFFYGWWDWRFLILLICLTMINYFIGLGISGTEKKASRKAYLIAGLVLDIGILCIFKYFNFFISSFLDLLSLFGYSHSWSSLRIILPLGISFYVFLSLSYILDIYKKNIDASRDVINVLLSLSFFPIILAGPIQRPSSLLPQISKQRQFSYNSAVDGLRQILWGLFVKMAIADNIGPDADGIFANAGDSSGSTLLLGIVLYTLQIYADFSGYSNIAIGTAKLLGFNLMRNFAYPYFARDITEFWRRWHISLTTWFRDYVFLPLSFSISWRIKKEKVLSIRSDHFIYIAASILTWFLTGLWHGASYSFIIWGLFNGFFLILYHILAKGRKRLFKKLAINNNGFFIVFFETLLTLVIVMVAWIFFRTSGLENAIAYISGILSPSLFTFPDVFPVKTILLAALFIVVEWFQRDKEHALQLENVRFRFLRWSAYIACIFIIMFLGGGYQRFIYFQF